jgi:hypothetical protein
MAKRELAERLLEALLDDQVLTESDTDMIGALVSDRGPAGWSWTTQNGALLNMAIAGETVRTVADLRRVVATLPPPKEGPSLGEAIAEAIIRAITPMKRELVLTQVKLSTLIEILEERGVELGADYTRRWYANFERDSAAIWDSVSSDDSEEGAARFRERHADWNALQDELRLKRFGPEVNAQLKQEWEAMMARIRAEDEKRRAEVEGHKAADAHPSG